MKINIYCPPVPYAIRSSATFHIAVEAAAFFVADQVGPLDLIIGDFDSSDVNTIKRTFPHVEILDYPTQKDETDSMLAVQEALKKDPERIYLYTNAGVRMDHSLANLKLLEKGPITLMNDHVNAYVLNPGTHSITPDFKYVSFFAVHPIDHLTLNGFKYSLTNAPLNPSDTIGISNEGTGTVHFKTGALLVIESSD